MPVCTWCGDERMRCHACRRDYCPDGCTWCECMEEEEMWPSEHGGES